MPLIKPDLTQVGPIPEGVYRAKITACEASTSKKGNDMVVPTFTMDVNGKTRDKDAFLVISGAGARNFYQLLRACGFEEQADAFARGETPEFDSDWFIGQEVMVNIQPDMYNGEPSEKIAGFLKV